MIDRLRKCVSVLAVHRGGRDHYVLDDLGRVPYFAYYGDAYAEASRQRLPGTVIARDFYSLESLQEECGRLGMLAVPHKDQVLVGPEQP